MITLYYDIALKLPGPSYQVFPLLEEFEKKDSRLHEAYKFVDSLEDCHYALVPMSIQYLYVKGYKDKLVSFIKKCEALGKSVLVFSGGDYGMTLPFPNVITVRLGGKDSKMEGRIFIMPPFINDPYHVLSKQWQFLDKPEQPTIGFVGHSSGSVAKYVREIGAYLKGNLNRTLGIDPTEKQSFYPSSVRRFFYLKKLERDHRVVTRFIHRKKYRAGARKAEERIDTQKEFYENMYQNLYTFCLRGTGNFSVRFYETLAMGRIPILMDTDCRLPFQDKIPWEKHAVIVKNGKADKMISSILEFHESLSQATCEAVQRENRLLWEKYFQKDTFFLNLQKYL